MENNNTFPLITDHLQDEIIKGAKKYNEEQANNIRLRHKEEFVKKETEIEMQKEDLASKPKQNRSRIVEGQIRKRLEDLALLEQD